MKKFFSLFLLIILIAGCTNNKQVNDSKVEDVKDDEFLTSNESEDESVIYYENVSLSGSVREKGSKIVLQRLINVTGDLVLKGNVTILPGTDIIITAHQDDQNSGNPNISSVFTSGMNSPII